MWLAITLFRFQMAGLLSQTTPFSINEFDFMPKI